MTSTQIELKLFFSRNNNLSNTIFTFQIMYHFLTIEENSFVVRVLTLYMQDLKILLRTF